MAYKIDCSKCLGCHSCMAMCPMGAISVNAEGKCEIDTSKCVSCGTCASMCPAGAITAE